MRVKANVRDRIEPKKAAVSEHKLLKPNAETIAAIEAVERGELATAANVDDLIRDLNEDD